MQKVELIQEQKAELPRELPITASELEDLFVRAGAEIIHPVRMDPVALKNGEVLAFWVKR